MILPKEAIMQFKKLYEQERNKTVSYETAEEMANRVYGLVKILTKQAPGNAVRRGKLCISRGGDVNDNVKKTY